MMEKDRHLSTESQEEKTTITTGQLTVLASAGFFALLIGNGIGRYGYPPLIPSLINTHWFTVNQADYLSAGNLTGYLIGAAIASFVSRFLLPANLIRLAMLITAVTFWGCSFKLVFPVYFLFRMVAGVCGGLIMVMTASTIFRYIPSNKKGLVGGIIFSGVGIGIALSGTLIPLLIKQGITITWLWFAALSGLFIVLSWNAWPDQRFKVYLPAVNVNDTPQHILQKRPIVLLMLSYACNAIGFVPHTVFWVDFVSRGLHMGIQMGNQLWILLGIAAAAGPVITGVLADRIGFAKSIRISLLVKGIGVMMPIFSTALWSLVISSVCVGSLALGINSLAAGRVAELTTPTIQKKVWGWMTIVFSITHAATAYLLSFLFSRTESYFLLFKIGAFTLIVGSLLDYLSSKSASVTNN
jgi:MFS family permease